MKKLIGMIFLVVIGISLLVGLETMIYVLRITGFDLNLLFNFYQIQGLNTFLISLSSGLIVYQLMIKESDRFVLFGIVFSIIVSTARSLFVMLQLSSIQVTGYLVIMPLIIQAILIVVFILYKKINKVATMVIMGIYLAFMTVGFLSSMFSQFDSSMIQFMFELSNLRYTLGLFFNSNVVSYLSYISIGYVVFSHCLKTNEVKEVYTRESY